MKISKILTKKWKQKQLKEGYYYIKTSTGRIEISHLHWWYEIVSGVETPTELAFDEYMYDEILLILAPVPTYEEYKAMQERIADQRAELESARWYQTVQNEDIGKLRGLLKECKNIVAHECWQEAQFPDGQVVNRQDLLTRINAALNETQANPIDCNKMQESEEK